MKISAKYSVFILKALVKKFEVVVDKDTKISNLGLSSSIKEMTDKQIFKDKFKEKYKGQLDMSNYDEANLVLAYDPICESGHSFNYGFTGSSNDERLNQSIITFKSSSKYKDINSCLIRTYMIDSDKNSRITIR